MAPAKKTKKDSSLTAELFLGAGALVAAAAGAYFLYGKGGNTRRKQLKGWMLKAQGEVMEKFEKAQHVSEDVYMDTVNTVAKKYAEMKHIDSRDVDAFVKELHGHWNTIKKELGGKKAPKKKTK